MRTLATVGALATAWTLAAALPGVQETSATRPVLSAVEDPEAYAIWATLLSDHWLVRHAGAKTLLIQQETTSNSVCRESEETMEPDWRRVLDDYKSANRAVRTVLADQRLGHPYIVVPADEIQSLFKQSEPGYGWSTFHSRYPDSRGYLEVSAVGFDAERRRAIAYLAHHCGGLCGGGAHHFLERVDGTWRKASIPGLIRCTWVS